MRLTAFLFPLIIFANLLILPFKPVENRSTFRISAVKFQLVIPIIFAILDCSTATLMDNNLFENLHAEGLISDDSLEKIRLQHAKPTLFSVHWEIRTLLYIGVLLLTSGLGLLIYENIDTIGHQFVLMLIGLICAGCFFYCFKTKLPFSRERVKSSNSYFDY
jgi:hypothetical protein